MTKPLLFSFLLLTACADSDNSDRKDGYSGKVSKPEDSMFEEVMHGHDTAMAKMGKISGYKKEIARKLDSLPKKGAAVKVGLENALKDLEGDLEKAESRMNKWMDDFSIDSAQDNVERRIEYLKSEKIKVDDVKEEIRKVLAKADSLLKK